MTIAKFTEKCQKRPTPHPPPTGAMAERGGLCQRPSIFETTTKQTAPAQPASQRPGCLMVVSMGLGIFQFIRLIYLARTPADLVPHVVPPVIVQFFTEGVWFVIFASLTVALAMQKRIALRYGVSIVIVFVGYNVARIALFAQADYNRGRVTILWLLAISSIILFIVRRMQVHLHNDNTHER